MSALRAAHAVDADFEPPVELTYAVPDLKRLWETSERSVSASPAIRARPDPGVIVYVEDRRTLLLPSDREVIVQLGYADHRIRASQVWASGQALPTVEAPPCPVRVLPLTRSLWGGVGLTAALGGGFWLGSALTAQRFHLEAAGLAQGDVRQSDLRRLEALYALQRGLGGAAIGAGAISGGMAFTAALAGACPGRR